MAEELVNLTTAVKRRAVVIDGKRIEMLGQDEMSLEAVVRLGAVVEAFGDKSRRTEDGARDLSARLVKAVRDILPEIPSEIDAKLTDHHRIEIVMSFLEATPAPAETAASASPASN